MPHSTSKLKIILILFRPSSESIIVSLFLSSLLMVINQSQDIQKLLELPRNIQVTRSIINAVDNVLTKVIGSAHTDTLVVGLFWAIVGLIVYILLHGLATFISELDSDLDVRHFVWPKGADRYRPLEILAERLGFRIAAFVALVAVIMGPLAVVIEGPVFVDFLGSNKLLQYVVWFIALLATSHVVVILLRLMALRARLFG